MHTAAWTPALLALAGCPTGSGDDTGGETTFDGDLTVIEEVWTTDADGYAEVIVDVAPGQEAFLLHGQSERFLSVEYVYDPEGNLVLDWEDWWDSDESLTDALFPDDVDLAFQWPVRAEDGPLTPGLWTVVVTSINANGNYVGNTPIDTAITLKDDPDLERANIRVQILLSAGTAADPALVSAVEQAVVRWQEVWADAGMTLETEILETDAPDLMPYPGDQPALYEELSALGDGTDLTLIVAESLRGSGGTYGVSGGLPGPLGTSGRGAVVVSWLANAGADATFSDADVRLFGETMGHEIGHYMGLYHPVEESLDAFDALSDTPRCASYVGCENLLGANLMFPYPLCDTDSCDPQFELTDAQVGVSQRYTGAL